MNSAVLENGHFSCFMEFPLFSQVDKAQLRALSADSIHCSYSKGEIVCEKGRGLEGMYCVLEGKVKLAVLSLQGNERVVDIVTPGNTFGETLVFMERPCSLYAQTLAPCELIFIRKARILEGVRRCPELALSLLEGLSRRLQKLVQDVEVCCLQSAGERLAGYLADQARNCKEEAQSIQFTLPASKAVVASTLNLTPETFSRELHQLAAQGLISVERSTIRIHDLAGLESSLTK